MSMASPWMMQAVQTHFKNKIPPGFMDVDKDEDERYGDLVLWVEIIEQAKSISKPIIFVTDDQKEDWWLRISGRTIGLRPELVAELWGATRQLFYMYSTDRFIEMAKARGHSQPSDATVSEIRDIAVWESRDQREVKARDSAELALLENADRIRQILQSGENWALAKRLELAALGNERMLREAHIADIYDQLKSEADDRTRSELVDEKNRLVRELQTIYIRLGVLTSDE
jgi:PIN like domain